jgi:hypothetical protein
MKTRYIAGLLILGCVTLALFSTPSPTMISVRVGQTFEEVVRSSTFPVKASSNIPNDEEVGFGVTLIKEPAVIIFFNDAKHGFTLPPTTFAGISYIDNKVSTIATSPMLHKLTFDKAAAELARLQRQFQAGGWQPEINNKWFDLTPQGLAQLRLDVRNSSNGFMRTIMLVVPEKYEMTFRLWCAARCDSQIGLDRYLIDIGLSADNGFIFQQIKRQREEAMTP